jgi:hypothetical protein
MLQKSGRKLEFRTDGNLVLSDAAGQTTFSATTGPTPDRLVMQSDANLVVYSTAGEERPLSA